MRRAYAMTLPSASRTAALTMLMLGLIGCSHPAQVHTVPLAPTPCPPRCLSGLGPPPIAADLAQVSDWRWDVMRRFGIAAAFDAAGVARLGVTLEADAAWMARAWELCGP